MIVGAAGSISTGTTLTATPNPVVEGASVALVANVTASTGTATGTVTFKYGQQVLSACTLSAGSCTYAAPSGSVPPGGYLISAYYNPSGNYLPSYSQPVSVTVLTNKITTSTALVAQPDPAPVGTSVTLSATVTSSSGTAPGSVSFYAGPYLLGSCVLVNASCSHAASTANLNAGSYTVTATSREAVITSHLSPMLQLSFLLLREITPRMEFTHLQVVSMAGFRPGHW